MFGLYCSIALVDSEHHYWGLVSAIQWLITKSQNSHERHQSLGLRARIRKRTEEKPMKANSMKDLLAIQIAFA